MHGGLMPAARYTVAPESGPESSAEFWNDIDSLAGCSADGMELSSGNKPHADVNQPGWDMLQEWPSSPQPGAVPPSEPALGLTLLTLPGLEDYYGGRNMGSIQAAEPSGYQPQDPDPGPVLLHNESSASDWSANDMEVSSGNKALADINKPGWGMLLTCRSALQPGVVSPYTGPSSSLGELRGGMGMDTREGLKTSDHQSQADVCKLSPMVPQGFVLASPSGAVEPDTESSASGLQVYHGDKSRDNIKALEPSGSQRQADVNGLSSTVYQQPPLQQQPGQVLPHNELSASGDRAGQPHGLPGTEAPAGLSKDIQKLCEEEYKKATEDPPKKPEWVQSVGSDKWRVQVTLGDQVWKFKLWGFTTYSFKCWGSALMLSTLLSGLKLGRSSLNTEKLYRDYAWTQALNHTCDKLGELYEDHGDADLAAKCKNFLEGYHDANLRSVVIEWLAWWHLNYLEVVSGILTHPDSVCRICKIFETLNFQAEASSMTNGTVGVPSQAEPPSGPAGPKRRRQECLEGPSLAEQGSSSMANQVPPAQVPPSLLPLPSLAATLKDGGQQVRLHMKTKYVQGGGVAKNAALEDTKAKLEVIEALFPGEFTGYALNGCVRFNFAIHTQDVDTQSAILHKLLDVFSLPAVQLKCTIALPASVLMVCKQAEQLSFTLTSMDQQQQAVIISADWSPDTRTVSLHGRHLRGARIWACIPGSDSVQYLPVINPRSEDTCLDDSYSASPASKSFPGVPSEAELKLWLPQDPDAADRKGASADEFGLAASQEAVTAQLPLQLRATGQMQLQAQQGDCISLPFCTSRPDRTCDGAPGSPSLVPCADPPSHAGNPPLEGNDKDGEVPGKLSTTGELDRVQPLNRHSSSEHNGNTSSSKSMELEGDELALSGDEGLAAGAAGTAAIPSTSMSQHDFNKQFSMLLQQPPQPGLVLPDNELSASGDVAGHDHYNLPGTEAPAGPYIDIKQLCEDEFREVTEDNKQPRWVASTGHNIYRVQVEKHTFRPWGFPTAAFQFFESALMLVTLLSGLKQEIDMLNCETAVKRRVWKCTLKHTHDSLPALYAAREDSDLIACWDRFLQGFELDTLRCVAIGWLKWWRCNYYRVHSPELPPNSDRVYAILKCVYSQVATLGKSGVSVGYYDTEDNAARAYDRAAIGLLGRDNCSITTNFPLGDYDEEVVPQLIGKSREEVKTTLKNERAKVPRRRFSSRQRTSRYMGVGSSNRKNQWQARILVHGKVTHLGYYETEEDAAKVYDRVSISLHGEAAQTNFPQGQYQGQDCREYSGLDREDLQRALGVKPMDKSSKFRGVSKKKGKWEAKVMVNRKWAYRELFDSEEEAARAYDGAVWRLKPKEAKSYVNFKERPGQGSSKLAKAARMIERAQAKERVGSSQNSPSSSRSLPPLAPAHEGGSDTAPPSYPLQQQGPQQPGQALQGFHVGIKLEPGTNFGPSATARAAQSAAVANLGAAPPPAGSPGSLSRTSSSHVPGVGNPMGPPRGNPTPPAWLCQPLSTPMPFSPQRVYQLDGTPATPTGRGGVFGNQQLLPMPPALMQQHSLSMSRTLSEADISNQSAMSALTGSSVHHTTLPPAASVSRQAFQAQSPPVGGNPQWSPVSPRKLRASMSYQDLSCQPFKQGLVSSPGFSSPTPAPLAPLHPQTQTQMPQHAQQHAQHAQQQQQQRGNMMVRVGSETHLLPETRGGYFRRVPSAPFMNLEQHNSGGRQFVSLDPRLQVEESPGLAPFGQWAPDSSQVLGVKQQQEASDMQVDMPMVSQAFAEDDAGVAQFSPRYMQAPQPGYRTPPSPSTLPPLPNHQHQQHRGMMSPRSCQQDSHMAPHMHQQHSHMSPRMLQPMQSQAVSPYCSPQQLSQQQQHQQQREHEQQLQQCEHDLQLQQQQQQFHQQQQEQQFQQREQQQQMRQQRMFQLQEQLQRQQQLQQQQGQMHAPGQGQEQGQGMSRSASVSHMNMQWQPPESFGRSASASNLMMQGQSWMNVAPNPDGSRNQYGDPMMTDQQMRSAASGMQFGHHGSHTMNSSPFDPTPQPGDDRGLDSIDSHHQDLLADLSASQILAQADLAECNSPLKIVQIGGDDLFENDETGANDFLLDSEAGLS